METDPLLDTQPVNTTPPKGFAAHASDQDLAMALVDRGRDLAEEERRAALETKPSNGFALQAGRPEAPTGRSQSRADWIGADRHQQFEKAIRHGKARAWLAWHHLRQKGQKTEDYLRSHSLNEMARDTREAIARHPVAVAGSLAAVVGLGLLKVIRK